MGLLDVFDINHIIDEATITNDAARRKCKSSGSSSTKKHKKNNSSKGCNDKNRHSKDNNLGNDDKKAIRKKNSAIVDASDKNSIDTCETDVVSEETIKSNDNVADKKKRDARVKAVEEKAKSVDHHTTVTEDDDCGDTEELELYLLQGQDVDNANNENDDNHLSSEWQANEEADEEESFFGDFDDSDDLDNDALSSKPVVQPVKQRKSILKAYNPRSIAIWNQPGDWGQLPPLDLQRKHQPSTPPKHIYVGKGHRSGKSNKHQSSSSERSRVRFADVFVRSYKQTVGDNPSVHDGAPIALDWGYQQFDPISVDEVESYRKRVPRRSQSHMILDPVTRERMLIDTCGASSTDITAATRQAHQDQIRRKVTNTMLRFSKVEEVYQSAYRKCKRQLRPMKASV